MFEWWPLMWKRGHDAVARENYTLRDALRSANEELSKHRRLIAGLRTGQTEVIQQVEKATGVSWR
jgi:hypothetical protein